MLQSGNAFAEPKHSGAAHITDIGSRTVLRIDHSLLARHARRGDAGRVAERAARLGESRPGPRLDFR
jgi:hypothetical protein